LKVLQHEQTLLLGKRFELLASVQGAPLLVPELVPGCVGKGWLAAAVVPVSDVNLGASLFDGSDDRLTMKAAVCSQLVRLKTSLSEPARSSVLPP
jgi:hypothetical protein